MERGRPRPQARGPRRLPLALAVLATALSAGLAAAEPLEPAEALGSPLEPADGPQGPEGGAVRDDATAVTLVRPKPRANSSEGGSLTDALRIVSAVRVTTPEALQAEIIAAEAALSLRAEVDGPPAVYDSPSVSISLRKVSPDALVESGAKLEAVDGASVTIPADPRVKGRHGGPVTVTVTSYHAGDKVKELPTVKYGAGRKMRRVGGPEGISGTEQKEDRVDFFMSKTSVSWRGTVNVKVPGLAAQVPAHDRPWAPFGSEEDVLYREEKEALREEVEQLLKLPADERLRGFRRLARKWHPDKNPDDTERTTEVFTYLQEIREALSDGPRHGDAS